MRGTDLPPQAWHKSSYSNASGDCVEVAQLGISVAARDSKDPAGPALQFEAGAWAAFVRSVANGEFTGPQA